MWFLLFACRPPPAPFVPVAPPEGYAHHGIDVSHWQGRIDWPEVAASGEVDFVFVKATEGRKTVDRRFARNWREAQAAGLPVGAYHYFSACRTGEEQADMFLATVEGGDLPAVLDVEPDARCNRGTRLQDNLEEVRTWLDRVEDATGTAPLLYASDATQRALLGDFEEERWVAAYSRAPRRVQDWLVWQHTDRGAIPGITGPVDRNVASAKGAERLGL